MRNFIFILIAIALPSLMLGQSAWMEPADAKPDDSVRLYVDLNQTSNDFGIVEIAAGGEDMYIWTWKPAEHPAGHPLTNGLGDQAWKNSNPALKMTKESDGVYYYEMVPTEFYEVDANTVYKEDIHFLVKPQDGGGYGDPDLKTEDLLVKVEPADCGPKKVLSFPDIVDPNGVIPMTGEDVFILVYDNKMEEKPSLQNNTTPLYVYARGTTANGVAVSVTSRSQIDNTPALRMTEVGDGVYHWYVIPDELYKDVVPAGDRIKSLRLQILQEGARTTDQVVFGPNGEQEFNYILRDE